MDFVQQQFAQVHGYSPFLLIMPFLYPTKPLTIRDFIISPAEHYTVRYLSMDIFGQKDLSDTPCIGICSTALGDEICVGCGRRFDEVCQWNTLSDEEKRAIKRRLHRERQQTKAK